jgi:hypothetical protein
VAQQHGIRADYYHGGVKDRHEVQRKWMVGETQVICATIAFGMGRVNTKKSLRAQETDSVHIVIIRYKQIKRPFCDSSFYPKINGSLHARNR